MAAACVAASLLLLVLPAGVRDRAASGIRGTVVAPLAAMQQRAALARRSFAAHDSLVALADSVVRRSQQLDEVTAENARLRGLLGLGRALRWGFVPAEALVGRGLGEEHTLVLSAGARAGVQRLSAVVAADGLVGMVRQVDPTTSVAITWPHPEFRVSATTPDGSAFGIVSAHAGGGTAGYLLELRGVPFRSRVPVGTLVVSSGLGGIYPRGIPIGRVAQELRTNAGWERTYLLTPAVRPPDVTAVLILDADRNGEGVESVWRAGRDTVLARQLARDTTLARPAGRDTAPAARARDTVPARPAPPAPPGGR